MTIGKIYIEFYEMTSSERLWEALGGLWELTGGALGVLRVSLEGSWGSLAVLEGSLGYW